MVEDCLSRKPYLHQEKVRMRQRLVKTWMKWAGHVDG